MKKKISLIECDYGKVYVKAIQNMRRDKVISIAKEYLENKIGNDIYELPNLNYYAPIQWKVKRYDDLSINRNKEYWEDIDLIEA